MGKNRRESRVHVVYRTTCLIDNTVYIGKHSQRTIDFDGYLGSGELLNAKLEEFGKDKFSVKVLAVLPTKEEAFAEETRQIALHRRQGYSLMNKVKNEGYTDSSCFDCCSVSYKQWQPKAELWSEAQMSPNSNICISCFENRLGRKFSVLELSQMLKPEIMFKPNGKLL